ncbi:sensor histidine kinase [Paenibacillus endoradicis]|uniref:sensor histidine kinase n=1 Tax=Paenibacillus endoradicis TaxID=2972487 RepID=UPI002159AEAE|nr:HAMP domain-containing sensor histidine kinase [Paenibacillus endoradicis]MCR8657242.1 HAMP domain-containing histidine kinase [Paenibacillus endoradicis]
MNDSIWVFCYTAALFVTELHLLRAGATLLLIVTVFLFMMLNKAHRKSTDLNQLIGQLQLTHQQLQLSERSAKEFVANVSHEIHTSLSSIQSFTDILEQQDLALQQRNHYVQIIRDRAGQLSSMSNQLLLLSRLENESKVIVKHNYSIKAQLLQALQLFEFQMTEKYIMSTIKASEQSFIYGDQVLMLQVWSNLLSNAIKHTPIGGNITIEASCNEQQCTVTFSDTGEGIAQERIAHVYERFYWEKHKHNKDTNGNGLGLSIVKKIVDLHAGTIHLSSEVHKGTNVTIHLPQYST